MRIREYIVLVCCVIYLNAHAIACSTSVLIYPTNNCVRLGEEMSATMTTPLEVKFGLLLVIVNDKSNRACVES